MTVGKWDANAWHKQHTNTRTRNGFFESAASNHRRMWLITAIVVGIAASGAATAATTLSDPDYVGVCHATGDGSEPFVFLLVAENGFEHGHHRHHDTDYFVDPVIGVCGSDAALYDTPDETVEEAVTEDVEDVVDGAGETTEDAAEETNDTTEDAAEETDGAADESEEAADEEVQEETPFSGDIAVQQSADQDEHQVVLTIVLENIGSDNVTDVALYDDLPDVRRPWVLSGTDAGSCTLDGNSLSCWFGEVANGESLSVTLQAYTDRIPCGESMTSTAWVESAEDVEERNNAASAGILARYC